MLWPGVVMVGQREHGGGFQKLNYEYILSAIHMFQFGAAEGVQIGGVFLSDFIVKMILALKIGQLHLQRITL